MTAVLQSAVLAVLLLFYVGVPSDFHPCLGFDFSSSGFGEQAHRSHIAVACDIGVLLEMGGMTGPERARNFDKRMSVHHATGGVVHAGGHVEVLRREVVESALALRERLGRSACPSPQKPVGELRQAA